MGGVCADVFKKFQYSFSGEYIVLMCTHWSCSGVKQDVDASFHPVWVVYQVSTPLPTSPMASCVKPHVLWQRVICPLPSDLGSKGCESFSLTHASILQGLVDDTGLCYIVKTKFVDPKTSTDLILIILNNNYFLLGLIYNCLLIRYTLCGMCLEVLNFSFNEISDNLL